MGEIFISRSPETQRLPDPCIYSLNDCALPGARDIVCLTQGKPVQQHLLPVKADEARAGPGQSLITGIDGRWLPAPQKAVCTLPDFNKEK